MGNGRRLYPPLLLTGIRRLSAEYPKLEPAPGRLYPPLLYWPQERPGTSKTRRQHAHQNRAFRQRPAR